MRCPVAGLNKNSTKKSRLPACSFVVVGMTDGRYTDESDGRWSADNPTAEVTPTSSLSGVYSLITAYSDPVISVEVTKTWADADDRDGMRPDSA
jgi:hypothetical protein